MQELKDSVTLGLHFTVTCIHHTESFCIFFSSNFYGR